MNGLVPGGDRFAIVAAYYIVASEYHSGQSSKGYRKLSQCVRMGFRPGMGDLKQDESIRMHIASLLWTRRRDIRRNW